MFVGDECLVQPMMKEKGRLQLWKELKHWKLVIYVQVLQQADVENARHLVSLLVKQAVA